jgi:ABC-type nitrate/sulfonate/bicarbonate transport system substrate-binding protein
MLFHRLALLTAFAAVAAAKDTVNLSLQPVFDGIAAYAALQFGWFDELDLEVVLSYVSFHSNSPPDI